jgi:predicted DNA-binding transcriptional regulator AlpA
MSDDILTIADLAARWKVSETTVKREVAKPKFPRPFIVGRSRRYRRIDVEQWEARR